MTRRPEIRVPSEWEGFVSPTGETHPCRTLGHEEYACGLLARILGIDESDVYDDDVGIGCCAYADDHLIRDHGWAEAHACGSDDETVYVELPNIITPPQRETLLRLIPALEGRI